jgi:NAD+ kinase
VKYGIVARIDNKEAISTSKKVINYLKKKSNDILIESNLAKVIDARGVPLSKMKADIVISIGGDGTILRTMQKCRAKLFGIRIGAVGFLTEIEPPETIKSLKRILDRKYIIDKRIKLKTLLNGKRLHDAINEVVLHSTQIVKMKYFEILVNGVVVKRIRADGLIVATPTGSTGYAMSVGSPILDPKLSALVIVPIASFNMSARPIVVPSDSKIEIKVLDDKPTLLVIDGQYKRKLKKEDRLIFTISEYCAEFIRFESDFYRKVDILRVL